MPEVTETPTYSLWKGKGGSEFERVGPVWPGHYLVPFLLENPSIYDIAWKRDDGVCYVIRRDGATRGGEE